jgi:hypothetical protein
MIELEDEKKTIQLATDDQTFCYYLCDITAPNSFVLRIAVKISVSPHVPFRTPTLSKKKKKKPGGNSIKILPASFSVKCLIF